MIQASTKSYLLERNLFITYGMALKPNAAKKSTRHPLLLCRCRCSISKFASRLAVWILHYENSYSNGNKLTPKYYSNERQAIQIDLLRTKRLSEFSFLYKHLWWIKTTARCPNRPLWFRGLRQRPPFFYLSQAHTRAQWNFKQIISNEDIRSLILKEQPKTYIVRTSGE
jgi:hypothetical protein